MIDLHQQVDPYDLELPYGLKVSVKPLTTAELTAAQAAARCAVEAIERRAWERSEAGAPLDELADLPAEGERDGFYQAQLIRELAVRQITDWTGVELEGGRAPPTPENIAAVMNLYSVGDAARNAFGPSDGCTSSPGERPNTAKPACAGSS